MDKNKEIENKENIKEQETVLKQGNEEIGGPKGLEPTRYGDWERNGRCIDF